jgi:hypothetical protein
MSEFTISFKSGIPARVDASRAAKLLGVNEHDISTLIGTRLPKPLGSPVPCARQYFTTCELVRLANDPQWLDRATRVMTHHWETKNAQRSDLQVSAPA